MICVTGVQDNSNLTNILKELKSVMHRCTSTVRESLKLLNFKLFLPWSSDHINKQLPPLLCKKQVTMNSRLRKLLLYQQIMQLNFDKKFRGTLQEIRVWLQVWQTETNR
jgi:hypothetical protein